MPKRKLFLALTAIMALCVVSTASAATTLKKLARSPFYPPGVSSAADLQNLVKERAADLQTGFAKAGNPDLFPAFMEQFPTANIVPVKVPPGETFSWMLFKKKKGGRVAVLKDVTWAGGAAFDAYRFHIDKDGKRYEFLVPAVCGNVTLKDVAMIPAPPPPAPVAAPAPPPVAPTPVAAPAPAPVAPAPIAAPAPVAPVVAPAPPPVKPAPVVVAPPPVAPAAAPVPPPPAKPHASLLVDAGFAHQPDPAEYAFARVGYEIPLVDRLYLMGLVGGYLRFDGDDGGSAFTADVLLDYHWVGRFSFGLGAGFWSGNDGQADLIANLGIRLFGAPEGGNGSLFLEARLPADDLSDDDGFARYGLGLRYRF